MKRLVTLIMMMFICIASFSQTYAFKTTSYAIKRTVQSGGSGVWSDWIPMKMTIAIDVGNDVVFLQSDEPTQIHIIDDLDTINDNNGGTQLRFMCIDSDRLRCTLRIRRETNGNNQIYIDYNDISIVYNVVYLY